MKDFFIKETSMNPFFLNFPKKFFFLAIGILFAFSFFPLSTAAAPKSEIVNNAPVFRSPTGKNHNGKHQAPLKGKNEKNRWQGAKEKQPKAQQTEEFSNIIRTNHANLH